MTYKTIEQLHKDIEYFQGLFEFVRRNPLVNSYIFKYFNLYIGSVLIEEYNETKKSDTPCGRVLAGLDISSQEYKVFKEIYENKKDFFMSKNVEKIFRSNGLHFDRSKLKKNKIIFEITNPYYPSEKRYEISYWAQLLMLGKEYTDEYKQLDFKLEEDSKRNSLDEVDGLYYAKIPEYSMDDIVLYKETKEKLRSALSREQKKDRIFKTWELGKVMPYGRSLTLNFRGPPGTGKTMAAHCLAHELDKKILIVRYDQLQNAYIGETEKNIKNVFKMARLKNSVLFFDEADAIALSRDNLTKSWEMSQVNTLLKELEMFEGICIFATNYADKYDKAFERRLTMHIDFKMPDKDMNALIIEKMLPKKSRAKDLDLDDIDLSGLNGGHIKNIILNAAGFAAHDSAKKIGKEHIMKALGMVKSVSKDNQRLNYIC